MAILEEPVKVLNRKNYINGEWMESKGEMVDVVNPLPTRLLPESRIT